MVFNDTINYCARKIKNIYFNIDKAGKWKIFVFDERERERENE